MTLADVIEVLVHYDVLHRELPSSELYHSRADELVGYCDHDRGVIVVHKPMSLMNSRNTMLHELAHASLHTKGVYDSEERVHDITLALFRELYPTYDYREPSAKNPKGDTRHYRVRKRHRPGGKGTR